MEKLCITFLVFRTVLFPYTGFVDNFCWNVDNFGPFVDNLWKNTWVILVYKFAVTINFSTFTPDNKLNKQIKKQDEKSNKRSNRSI